VPVIDAAEREALRRRARGVRARALALAAAGTAVTLALRFLAGGR
jgi:hypothetical protein